MQRFQSFCHLVPPHYNKRTRGFKIPRIAPIEKWFYSQINDDLMKWTILCSLIVLSLLFVATTAFASDSKTLFDNNCAKCHGTDGKGVARNGTKAIQKDFTDASVQSEFADDRIVKSIRSSIPNLGNDEIRALVAYIRAFMK